MICVNVFAKKLSLFGGQNDLLDHYKEKRGPEFGIF